jgi:hypothetical protein
MGAWGEKTFQNDSSLDWLAELDAGGVEMLRDTLSRVADTDQEDYLDVDDGTSAIAAAEIVAAALGHGRDRLTEAAITWLDANPGALVAEDLTLANRAVERVLAGESELRALWDENGPDNAWHLDVRILLDRLAGGAGADTSTLSAANKAKPSRRPPVGERDKQVLVTFLRARGLEPTAQEMARISASQDAEEIRRWLIRAVEAPSVAAVLDG